MLIVKLAAKKNPKKRISETGFGKFPNLRERDIPELFHPQLKTSCVVVNVPVYFLSLATPLLYRSRTSLFTFYVLFTPSRYA